MPEVFESGIDLKGSVGNNFGDPTVDTDADNQGSRNAAITAALADFTRIAGGLVGDGTTTKVRFGHNLSTTVGVIVQVVDTSTLNSVEVEYTIVDNNNIDLNFDVAPGTNQMQVTVIGR